MGALGHYLEAEGIATTGISLVREHTEAIRPPRALWVPFMFGRPFGVPGDAAFQRRVLLRALALLEAPAVPVLEDFPDDAPESAQDEPALVCPVSFARPAESGLLGAIQREIADLAPWHARSERPSTTPGLNASGLSPAEIARFLVASIDDPFVRLYRENLDRITALRLACHDLKAYYLDAVLRQPGAGSARAAEQWFWEETAAGEMFLKLREACTRSSDAALQRFGSKGIVPMRVTLRKRAQNG